MANDNRVGMKAGPGRVVVVLVLATAAVAACQRPGPSAGSSSSSGGAASSSAALSGTGSSGSSASSTGGGWSGGDIRCDADTGSRTAGFQQWFQSYLQARCAVETACAAAGNCQQAPLRACARYDAVVQGHVEGPGVVHDASCSQRCLEALQGLPCERLNGEPAACITAMLRVGEAPRPGAPVGPGELCVSRPCQAGLVCPSVEGNATSNYPARCPVCVPPLAQGARCGRPEECASNACGSGGPGQTQCGQPVRLPKGAGEACTTDGECRDLLCEHNRCASRQRPGGAPCESTDVCARTCEAGACTCEVAVADGEPCNAGPCLRGSVCVDLTGTAVCTPLLDVGAPCVTQNRQSACKGFCAPTGNGSAVCVSLGNLPGAGAACAEGHGGLFCAPGTTRVVTAAGCVCQGPLPDGQPCTSAGQCQSGACVEGTCGPSRANGEPCTGPADCTSLACDLGVCVERCPAASSSSGGSTSG